MRKLKILMLAALSAVVFFSFFSCGKTTNNTTTVKDSIYYSPWIKFAMTATDNGDTVYYQDVTASKLTQHAISTGAVVSYVGEPATPSTGDTAVVDLIAVNALQYLTVGTIEVDAFGYQNNLSGLLYRYVIIPGTVLSTTSLHNFTQQQLQHMTFTELQKAANTPLQQSSGSSFNP